MGLGTVMKYMKSLLLCLVVAMTTTLVLAQQPEDSPRQKRTAVFTELGTQDCLRCHSGEKMHAVQAGAHGNTENSRTPAAQQGCESCHGPGSIHISRAHGGRGFPPLITFGRGANVSSRDEQIHVCMACHAQQGTATEVISFVGSPHDQRTINCSTCHKVHVASDPMRDHEKQMTNCRRCHRRQIEEHPRFESKSIDFDKLSCGTCHDVHIAVVEDGQGLDTIGRESE